MKARSLIRCLFMFSILLLVACTTPLRDNSPSGAAIKPAGSLVLVTGITGTQGNGVATALLEKGYRIRGLTRDPASDKSRAWSARGAEMVKGDFNDYESINAAVKGVDYLFLNILAMPDYIAAAKHVIDAAAAAGVKHIVFTSARLNDPESGFDENAENSKRMIELYLRNSGYPYTTLRIPKMMENFTRPADKQRLLTEGIVDYGTDNSKSYYISTYDMGVITAAAFANSKAWQGREVNLAADALTERQLAELLRKITGLDIAFKNPSWAEYRGDPNFLASGKYYDQHEVGYDLVKLRKEFPGMMTLEQFLRQNGYEKLGETRTSPAGLAAPTRRD